MLEGAIKPEKLGKVCAEMNFPAVGITDTANLFGVAKCSEYLFKANIQPLIGCIVHVDFGRQKLSDLTLLVQNNEGYKNLMKIVSYAYMQDSDEFGNMRVKLENLEKYNEGLIALSGGVSGEIGQLLLVNDKVGASNVATKLNEIFSGRFYLELARHGMNEEIKTEDDFIDIALKQNIPLVAVNDCCFLKPEMYEAHDALLCIAEGKTIGEDNRKRLTSQHYFKSEKDMCELFSDIPEALENSVNIAKRCLFKLKKRDPLLPRALGEGVDENEAIDKLAHEGLKERMQGRSPEEFAKYQERLEYELGVIKKMGFAGYFLIVSDFISWAKKNDIPVGPGRGSGAGSVVAWVLVITDLDPIRFNLLFERFLNPERVNMPDFDVDFCQTRREEVIKYVQNKYGNNRVAQIITFGKLMARAVLRDVGRVLGLPYGQVDKICKLVPNPVNGAPVTLTEARAGEPELDKLIAEDEKSEKMWEIAVQLEGLYRHASTHAAGVVIGDRPIEELVAVYRDPKSDMPVTQFDMKYVENTGLIKYDFLGLKTLSVIKEAERLLKKRGIEVDTSKVSFEDEKTFKLLGSAVTMGVFQLESSGMKDVLRKMLPDKIEDIIAIVALYRPGPMDNIPSYIRRKKGEEKPDYLHPLMEPILKETYGIMIYQEQVMQVAQVLAGYTLGGADLLRRAMGKKIKEEMDKQRGVFIEGCVKTHNIDSTLASSIFDVMEKFASYGFNKSHAAAYAVISYQTAYLKAHYAPEFLAASMSFDLANFEKLASFKEEAKSLGIKVLSPDVNYSDTYFSVEDGAVRYALAALKNFGENAAMEIVKEREAGGAYKDIYDFVSRLAGNVPNRRGLETLIQSGAFDSIHKNRAELFENIDMILRYASDLAYDRKGGQTSLFGGSGSDDFKLKKVASWNNLNQIEREAQALGFYLSNHPMDIYDRYLKRMRVDKIADLQNKSDGEGTRLAGIITSKSERISKKGRRYITAELSDSTGSTRLNFFKDEVILSFRSVATEEKPVVITAEVKMGEGEMSLFGSSIKLLDEAIKDTEREIIIYINKPQGANLVKNILDKDARGNTKVTIMVLVQEGEYAELMVPGKFRILPEIIDVLRGIDGVNEVQEI
jgi:DNA polymerase-3 subunit alpha